MTLNVQLMTMVSMVIGGFYLGVAHDTYSRFAHLWKSRQVTTYLLAIIFWLVQAGIIFFVLYKVNYGELRVYVFLACLLGFAMYQSIAATLYRRLLEMIIKFTVKLSQIVYRIFHILVLQPIYLIIRTLLALIKFLSRLILSIIIVLLWPFKMVANTLYRLIPKKIKKTFDKNSSLYSIIEYIYSRVRKLISFIRR